MVDTLRDTRIRAAKDENTEAIVTLLAACQHDLLSRHIHQWPATFPDPAEVAREIADGHTHILLCRGSITATVTLSPHMPKLAQHVRWLTDQPFLRICRLAVHPHFQRHGLGRSLMGFVEQLARGRQIASLRLGAYSQHPGAVTFYEGLGYQRVGEAINPLCPDPFICMEKVLPAEDTAS
jgi:ribosomal protein S18 acetylase RimI-like enzyme